MPNQDKLQSTETSHLRFTNAEPLILGADGTTSDIQVLRTGTFFHRVYGKFTIAMETLQRMVDNFQHNRPKPPTELVVDYEHLSASDPPQIAPAAGWFKHLYVKGRELWATVGWTEKAAAMIRAGEYRFISPEFTLSYKDKETGEDLGPVLFASALTNRPFFDGMAPVVLGSELEASMAFDEDALPDPNDHLPDECFAFVRPGGTLDAEGKTTPRNLRFLPFKDEAGGIDVPQLRYALAQLPQTSLTPEEQSQARKHLTTALRGAEAQETVPPEAPPAENTTQEEPPMDEAKLRELLGIAPDADIEAAIMALKEKAAKAAEAEQQVEQMQATERSAKADAAVQQAITDKKLLPKQADAAKTMYLKDPDAFNSFLATAGAVGPELGERGAGGGGENAVTLTATQKETAKRLGVSEEAYIKQLQREAQPAE